MHPATRSGVFEVLSLPENFLAYAAFRAKPADVPASGCTLVAAEVDASVAPPFLRAGDLAVTYPSAKKGDQVLRLAWDDAGHTYEGKADVAAFERADIPDAPIRFAASGGDVPAFEASVPAAWEVTVTNRRSAGSDTEIFSPVGSDLTLTWSNAKNERVDIVLWGYGKQNAVCHVETPATSFTIPAAIVDAVRDGAPGMTGCEKGETCIGIDFRGVREAAVRVGDVDVRVQSQWLVPLVLGSR